MKLYLNLNNNRISIDITKKENELFDISSEFLIPIPNSEYLEIRSTFFSKSKRIKNVWRYVLKKENTKYKLISHKNSSEYFGKMYRQNSHYKFKDKEVNEDIKNIIFLILESPHVKEYSSRFNPIAPSVGQSGNNIENLFGICVLPILERIGIQITENEEYNLVIINPIPFQTSLAEIHKEGIQEKLRNKVWIALFPFFKKEFIKVISNKNAKIIINACTADLKQKVGDELKSIKIPIFETPHPASWNYLKSFKNVSN